MTLLFDQNLSPRLVERLGDIYPGASHVSMAGLERASDDEVWSYALAHDYAIVTKDSDFSDASVLRGVPPKVVWIRLGNCTTNQIEVALRDAFATVVTFLSDSELGVLEVV